MEGTGDRTSSHGVGSPVGGVRFKRAGLGGLEGFVVEYWCCGLVLDCNTVCMLFSFLLSVVGRVLGIGARML